jgi:hypothetical protein
MSNSDTVSRVAEVDPNIHAGFSDLQIEADILLHCIVGWS